ncbi:disulfide bond formation protein DsbA [Ignatzschineria ureiclastica]|uniref:Disulfide bond formation protein DsbA n=1 Tax=Ignatzschineria ureiclastica TaxID=472582 RepID=A0A2U2AE47_9GAMM|nr:DsbA family oxidoreductase [Ignatzschineria ureiclastica]PWD80934.1 disulfide bond formation protein DsbA [Ignatzschineria ureiclastica]GGZ93784.1 DSBA oxidoreductase [Ignatzschineria ureiclastica]
MNIQIWSDFSCPFCYIGKHNLEQAIMLLSEDEMAQIKIQYRSFELAPDAPLFTDQTLAEVLAERYQTTVEKAKELTVNSAGMAATVGLTINNDKIIPTNTFLAHQLLHYVANKAPSKIKACADLLFKGYFQDGINLSDIVALIEIADKLKLDLTDVKKALDDEVYVNAVRDDEAIAHRINIQSVPFFVIDNEVAIQGAQKVEDFHQFLVEYLKEQNKQGHENTPTQDA